MVTSAPAPVCIRAPYAVWTTCRCPECIQSMLKVNKLQRHGRYHRVPSSAAWDVIEKLRKAGWSNLAIGTAAGIPPATVSSALRRGRDWRWGPHHAAAIVNHGRPTAGQVGTYAARRRLHALAAVGWTLDELAARSGVRFSTLAAIRAGSTTRVGVALAVKVAALFDELGMVPGPSQAARDHAVAAGWVSALAWDDIDDPAERPKLGRRRAGRPGGTSVSELEHLMEGQAWTWSGLTARLGVSKSAIEHLCERNDRLDLLRRIQRYDDLRVAG